MFGSSSRTLDPGLDGASHFSPWGAALVVALCKAPNKCKKHNKIQEGSGTDFAVSQNMSNLLLL